MYTCNECFHANACRYQHSEARTKFEGKDVAVNNVESMCPCFFDGSNAEIHRSATWCKHSPDKEMMRMFHASGVGTGMSESSIFWTCSNCGAWGSLIYRYCTHCGAKMNVMEGQGG